MYAMAPEASARAHQKCPATGARQTTNAIDNDQKRHSQAKQQPKLQEQDHSTAVSGNRVRIVRLHHDGCTKLGFSLRGGKETARSPVGVLVSHVEQRSEADKKGLKVGDLLLQVNGFDVNKATYEEVIGLIKQTPKRQDVVLKVTNLGRVPFQENPGAPIIWIKVSDLINNDARSPSTSPDTIHRGPIDEFQATINGSLISSSDEGIENYSYSSSTSGPMQQPTVAGAASCQSSNSARASKNVASSLDAESLCSSSGAGSISSLTIGCTTQSSSGDDDEAEDFEEETYRDMRETLIKIPGGRKTNESFGCDVVKGPEEWPGIFVQSVKQASLAQRCGLQLGDQLVRADGIRLDEMSFEAAIRLIKRLQQQQEEMLLHVKKGAALRYLASRQQQQHQAHTVQQQPVDNKNGYGNNNKSTEVAAATQSADAVSRCTSRSTTSSKSSGCHGEWAPNEAAPARDEEDCSPAKLISANEVVVSQNTRNNSKKSIIGDQLTPKASGRVSSRYDLLKASSRVEEGEDDNNNKWARQSSTNEEVDELAGEGAYLDDNDAETECYSANQSQTKLNGCSGARQISEQVTVSAASKALSRQQVQSRRKQYLMTKNDEEEEIRIVSQSCKLHPHHPQSGLSQSQVLDKFPHPAARLQRLGAGYRDQPAGQTARRRQSTTVDEMRRKLEPQQGSQIQQQRATQRQIQRYKSMDSLAQVNQATNCPFVQQPLRRPPRSASVSRQLPPQPAHNWREFDCEPTEHQRYLRQSGLAPAIYRRSASVLGQPMLDCCSAFEEDDLGDETLRYMAADYARLSNPAASTVNMQQCCSLVRHQRRRQQICAQQAGNNTLLASPRGLSMFAGGCRAQSMDRLNINLNYLKIGFNQHQHHYQPARAPAKQIVASGVKQRALAASRQCLLMQANASRVVLAQEREAVRYAPRQVAPLTCCNQLVTQQARTRQTPLRSRECSCDRISMSSRNIPPPAALCSCCCPQPVPARPSRQRESRPLAPIRSYGSQMALDSSSTSGFSSAYTSMQSSICAGQESRVNLRKVTRAPQPPPMFTRADCNRKQQQQAAANCISSSKNVITKQVPNPPVKRLTTFQAANPPSQPHVASDESSAYSQSYFSTTSSSGSVGSTTTATSSCESSSPVGLATTLGRPELLGHQPLNCSSPKLSGAANRSVSPNKSGGARLAPPRPPPMPASSVASDSIGVANGCKLTKRQLAGESEQSASEPSATSNGSGSDSSGKPNRLCFVDELKMMAKKQSTTADHSSTLVKIINASKSGGQQQQQRGKGCGGAGYACGASGAASGCCKCLRQANPNLDQSGAVAASKSVKLSEEDNKRRQHEMLMKEFKSAHSRMFNKRREGANANANASGSTQTSNSTSCQLHRPADDKANVRLVEAEAGDIQAPSNSRGAASQDQAQGNSRTTVKMITTKKTNLMQHAQQVHLAAAN